MSFMLKKKVSREKSEEDNLSSGLRVQPPLGTTVNNSLFSVHTYQWKGNRALLQNPDLIHRHQT